eukprot:4392900-Amphidinium_carterae.1
MSYFVHKIPLPMFCKHIFGTCHDLGNALVLCCIPTVHIRFQSGCDNECVRNLPWYVRDKWAPGGDDAEMVGLFIACARSSKELKRTSATTTLRPVACRGCYAVPMFKA